MVPSPFRPRARRPIITSRRRGATTRGARGQAAQRWSA